MKHVFSRRMIVAVAGLAATLLTGAARADLVLLGSDYFATVQPTFFTPLGALNPLAGLPVGPGNTDTIVQRQANCALDLGSAGSNCSIPIEMVALQLVSTVNPMVMVRESPIQSSTGGMLISSDGSGTGGTFDSFFDIFIELSTDGGATFVPQPSPLHLASAGAVWSTQAAGLLVAGPVGDQDANRHTNRNTAACPVFDDGQLCVDFFLVGTVTEQHPGVGVHTAEHAIPEPGSLALLGLALVAAVAVGTGAARRRARSGWSGCGATA
ncbi:PEP-CTERM sorting domain-containing protein [Candidatus Accumulibacter sp. ACC003]|uniref:PEP-CTERM sorting domain-containing protein n=1 Tax=Candidatus Accumulibacter sp. ACC003 TaxID=2823334 RepID=UPI0025C248EA|nr:PEP-CTERM sorting domain-containing protein [Candidatus Accumulibacter sp. ACC003]